MYITYNLAEALKDPQVTPNDVYLVLQYLNEPTIFNKDLPDGVLRLDLSKLPELYKATNSFSKSLFSTLLRLLENQAIEREYSIPKYTSITFNGVKEPAYIRAYPGNLVRWCDIEALLGEDIKEEFFKWMRGQTVAGVYVDGKQELGVYVWDLQRFVDGKEIID